MKRTTRHCYTQNMRALGLVVSEKKIFICFSIVSLWELSVKLGYTWGIQMLLFLIQNIDCGDSLEPPWRGYSNSLWLHGVTVEA